MRLSLPNYSSRLTYRLFEVEEGNTNLQDVEEIWQIDQDPKVMQFITGGKTTTKEALYNTFLPRIRSYINPDKGYGMWRVALRETDQCIGEIIVRPMHFFTSAPHYHDIELGWRFGQAYWGQGYATEAARHIMSAMARQPEVRHFSAIADTENIASIAIMKKLGMRYVSHGVHHDPLGEWEVDTYRVSIADLATQSAVK